MEEWERAQFLGSMTFATAGNALLPNCDVAECDDDPTVTSSLLAGSAQRSRRSVIPEAIRLAIQEHQTQAKRQGNSIRRTQHRTLVRQSALSLPNVFSAATTMAHVSVWEWTLPLGAEPMLEFGNGAVDRFIWVKRLSKQYQLQTIGTGVVGSAHEERGRRTLDWQEGQVWHVPSCDGNAVGWILVEATPQDAEIYHGKTVQTQTTTTTAQYSGPAVLLIASIPGTLRLVDTKVATPAKRAQVQADKDTSQQWSNAIQQIYSQYQAANTNSDPTKLPSNLANQFKQVVASLLLSSSPE